MGELVENMVNALVRNCFVRTPYGWGLLTYLDSRSGKIVVELDWGTLYGLESVISANSVAECGSCVRTRFGEGVLLDFRTADEIHVVSLWNGSAVAYLNGKDILEVVGANVGSRVVTPYGLGLVQSHEPASGKYVVKFDFGKGYFVGDSDLVCVEGMIQPAVHVFMASVTGSIRRLKTNFAKFAKVFERLGDGTMNISAAYEQIARILESKDMADKLNETWQKQRQNLIDNLSSVKTRIIKLIEDTNVTDSLGQLRGTATNMSSLDIKLLAKGGLTSALSAFCEQGSSLGLDLEQLDGADDPVNNAIAMFRSKRNIEEVLRLLNDNSSTILGQSMDSMTKSMFGTDQVDLSQALTDITKLTRDDMEMQRLLVAAEESYEVCNSGWRMATETLAKSLRESESGKLLTEGGKRLHSRIELLMKVESVPPTSALADGGSSQKPITKSNSNSAVQLLETVTQKLSTAQGKKTIDSLKGKLISSVSQLSLESFGSDSDGGVDCQRSSPLDLYSRSVNILKRYLPSSGELSSSKALTAGLSSTASMLYQWFSSLYNSTKKDNALLMLIGENFVSEILAVFSSAANKLNFSAAEFRFPSEKEMQDLVRMRLTEILTSSVLFMHSIATNGASRQSHSFRSTFPTGSEIYAVCMDPWGGLNHFASQQLSVHGSNIMATAAKGIESFHDRQVEEVLFPLLGVLQQIIQNSSNVAKSGGRLSSYHRRISNSSRPSSVSVTATVQTAVTSSLSTNTVTSMAKQLLTIGDNVLDSIESIRNSDTVVSAIQSIQSGQLQQSILEQLQTTDHSEAFTLAEQAIVDRDARLRLISSLQSRLVEFLSTYLPTLSIPPIAGVQDEVEYYVSGLNLSQFKLKKEGISISITDDIQEDSEVLKFNCEGVDAKFVHVIWNYSQMFFPHLTGTGYADVHVNNASIDLSFKIVKVPSGVSVILGDGSLDSQQKLQRLGERFPSIRKFAGLDTEISLTSIPANVWSVDTADAEESWEPILIISKRIISIESLQMTIDNSGLSWLYNMLINIFSHVIKEYVCSQLEISLTESAASLLSPLNNVVAYNWLSFSRIINVKLEKLPQASMEELYSVLGVDLSAIAGKVNRDYVLKFAEPTPLGLKLDMIKKTVMNQVADKLNVIGVIKGSQAESVLRALNLTEPLVANAQIRSVNGKSIVGLSTDEGLAELRGPRPLHVAIRLSDAGYNQLLAQRNLASSGTSSASLRGLKLPTSSRTRGISSSPASSQSTPGSSGLSSSAASFMSKMNSGVHNLVNQVQQHQQQIKAGSDANMLNRQRRKLPVVKAVFGGGPLGLKLRESKSCGGAVIVSGFSPGASGEALQAELLGTIESGMIMLSIGSHTVFGKPFDEVMTILKTTARPVTVLFTKSPDSQVNFYKFPEDLSLQKVDGEVVVTATCRSGGSPPTDTTSCSNSTHSTESHSTVTTPAMLAPIETLKPGCVVIQVNQTRITAEVSVEEVLECIRMCLDSSGHVKVAVRDMDAFVHLIRIRDGVEGLGRDVEIVS